MAVVIEIPRNVFSDEIGVRDDNIQVFIDKFTIEIDKYKE